MPELLDKNPETALSRSTERESIWKRLTRLFRSGPVVRHKIAAGEKFIEPHGTASAFKRELSSLYVHSLASYGQYERLSRYADYSEMEFCLSSQTLIATPCGFKTIEELARIYGLERSFIVYSYDHEKGEIVPAFARQARKTRTDEGWKVKFDNGKEIIGTLDHRLMLRDGSYKTIGELKPGDSMMPFYRKTWWSEKSNDDPDHYQCIYNGKRWITEHRMIASWVIGRELDEHEVVHHVNFKKNDNTPDNLRVMTDVEHRSYHQKVLNGKKWNAELNSEWIKRFKKNHSEFMKRNNPSARRDITFDVILDAADKNDFNLFTVMRLLDIDYPTIVRRLKEYKFKNWGEFARAYKPLWKNHGHDNTGDKNPRWDDSFTFQTVCDAFRHGMNAKQLCESLNASPTKVKKRIEAYGYKSIVDFCSSYENCKVVSVEHVGMMDMYDLTVDGYKNFATDSVISHNTPEIFSALDIYADEVTSYNENHEILGIRSSDPQIKQALETLFFDVLNIEFNLWSWVRNLTKYGDFVLFIDASEANGILNLLPIPINEIEREEGYDKEDPFAVRYRWLTQGNRILQNWQVIHFRLLGNDGFLPYGTSVIESARRIWRQLILIEDAMLVYRIVRSPERRVFYIDVGNIPADDVDQFMELVKTKLKRTQVVDPNSGRVDLRYNPLSVDEDYFIPVRGDKSSRIDTLPGGQFTGDVDDVAYIQNKLFAALKVPKAYLGYESEIGSKSTLSQQDVRFSRTIERIQRVVIAELNKIAIVHLFLLGYGGDDLVDFELSLAGASTIAEQQKLELWRMKFEIAGTAQEGMLDRETIYRTIFKMNDEQIQKVREGKRSDRLEDLQLESMKLPEEEAPPAPEETEELPGEGELPRTLGGEQPPAAAAAAPAGEGVEREARNPGSEGDRAEVAVDKGRDMFSTGEDQHELVFGTKKQTASDPFDRRASHRLVTRPFSEARGRRLGPSLSDLKGAIRAAEKLEEQVSEALEESTKLIS